MPLEHPRARLALFSSKSLLAEWHVRRAARKREATARSEAGVIPARGPQRAWPGASAVPRLLQETPLSALREICSDLKASNGQHFARHGGSRRALRGSIPPLPMPSTEVSPQGMP